jgi:fructokinase
MPDIICLGEVLIDFVSTEAGVTLAQAPAFEKAPGGAPANVAVGLARLGVDVGFMGKVGDDDFGHFLADTLSENGVDVSTLRFDTQARTALAFVSLTAEGERDFMFYRHPSADMLFRPGEVDTEALGDISLLTFGSISLIVEPSREATLHAVTTARDKGALIAYDPNLRLNLWPSAEAAREGMLTGWPLAHVIKVSREELTFLSGEDDLWQGAAALWHEEQHILLITDGPNGAYYYTSQHRGHVAGIDAEAVDTTGAGDAFFAGFLSRLAQSPDLMGDTHALAEAICFANAAGAATTTKRGAIPALPTPSQIDDYLA